MPRQVLHIGMDPDVDAIGEVPAFSIGKDVAVAPQEEQDAARRELASLLAHIEAGLGVVFVDLDHFKSPPASRSEWSLSSLGSTCAFSRELAVKRQDVMS